jgi:hypothetical protein
MIPPKRAGSRRQSAIDLVDQQFQPQRTQSSQRTLDFSNSLRSPRSPRLSQSPALFSVQSANVVRSFTKKRLPETTGAAQVALSATV